MNIYLVLSALLLGIIYGFFLASFYCDAKSKAPRVLTVAFGVVGNSGLFAVLAGLRTLFDVDTQFEVVTFYFLLTSILSFGAYCYYTGLKLGGYGYFEKEDGFLNIFLNMHSEIVRHSKESHEQMIEAQAILDTRENELNTWALELEELETELKGRERKINKKIRKKAHMALPIKKAHPIDQNFMNKLKDYATNYAKYVAYISDLTEQYLRKIADENNTNSKKDLLDQYFRSIAFATCTKLFNSYTGVKTLFRVLDTDNQLVHYVGVEHQDIMFVPADTMNHQRGLIKWSLEKKRAVVKSLNQEESEDTKNSAKWPDYITATFPELRKDGLCMLTMAIAVEDEHKHSEFLYFLNHVNFDRQLEHYFKKLNKEYDIADTLCEGRC